MCAVAKTLRFEHTQYIEKFGQDMPEIRKRAAVPSQSTAPVIISISPSTLQKQSQPQTLRVDGARFGQGLIVTLNDPTGKAVQYSGGDIANQTANNFTLTVPIRTATRRTA
jgi:hypothetical protein